MILESTVGVSGDIWGFFVSRDHDSLFHLDENGFRDRVRFGSQRVWDPCWCFWVMASCLDTWILQGIQRLLNVFNYMFSRSKKTWSEGNGKTYKSSLMSGMLQNYSTFGSKTQKMTNVCLWGKKCFEFSTSCFCAKFKKVPFLGGLHILEFRPLCYVLNARDFLLIFTTVKKLFDLEYCSRSN